MQLTRAGNRMVSMLDQWHKVTEHNDKLDLMQNIIWNTSRISGDSQDVNTMNWKVVGSIANGAIGIFHWNNPSGCTVALQLAQPLTKMGTRHISSGLKVDGA